MSDKFSAAIEQVYDRIGREGSRAPEGLALPVGYELAQSLGYPQEVLDSLPAEALRGFVGAAPLPASVLDEYSGGLVVDCGAGAGVDSFWLASKGVETVALEWSREMLARLKRAATGMSLSPMSLRAKLPTIPLACGSAEWVSANGVVNIIEDKAALLKEIRRVLKSGGRFIAADIIALEPLDPSLVEDGEAWAFCVAGAKTVVEWEDLLEGAGFSGFSIKVLESFPPLGRGFIQAFG